MLYSQHFTFHWKLLVLVSRIEKSGTGDNNFGKWKAAGLKCRSQVTGHRSGHRATGHRPQVRS